MRVRLKLWTAAVSTTLLSLFLAGAARLDSAPLGLTGAYESLGGPPRTVTAIDSQLSAARILDAWSGSPPLAFDVTWRGVIFVPSDGAYTFAVQSDDEASIYLDGRAILESGGGSPPGMPPVRATVRPDRGAHAIIVRYVHNGGPVRFDLSWAHGDEPLAPIPSWTLRTRRIPEVRILLSRWLPLALALAEWLAALTILAALAATGAIALRSFCGRLRRAGAPRALAWIVGGSALLDVVGLWWGLPNGGWAPIELAPVFVIGGLSTFFSHGWVDAYPPVHYYILSVAISPVLALDWLGRVDVHDVVWGTTMMVIERLVSVAMTAGTIVAVYFCGQIAFSRRAGLFAAATFALVAPLLYFAKIANVDAPYVFWFALSMVLYLRLLAGDQLRDYMGLAVTMMLAICTKDQAYGLYLLPPLVLFYEKRLNWRLFAAGFVSVAAFALFQNLAFNFDGFLGHLRVITGTGASDYRLFEPTLAGRLQLLRLVVRLTELSWGWPLFLISLAGVLLGAASPAFRRPTIWLLAPIVGYYLGLLNIVLYAYDRFMLPVCVVLALFAGLALDRFMADRRERSWRAAAVAVVFAYTLLYSGTVDVLMVRDSRYAAERWLDAHAAPGDLIAIDVLPFYVPRLVQYRIVDVQTAEDLKVAQPRFFILNVDYTRGERRDRPHGKMIAGLEQHELGYGLVYRGRTASPWPWLPGAHRDLVGSRVEPIFVSSLRNINPTIEIFERDASP